jgi:hypothetical protein
MTPLEKYYYFNPHMVVYPPGQPRPMCELPPKIWEPETSARSAARHPTQAHLEWEQLLLPRCHIRQNDIARLTEIAANERLGILPVRITAIARPDGSPEVKVKSWRKYGVWSAGWERSGAATVIAKGKRK